MLRNVLIYGLVIDHVHEVMPQSAVVKNLEVQTLVFRRHVAEERLIAFVLVSIRYLRG